MYGRIATAWLLFMFTDAGAHFMQYRPYTTCYSLATGQTVETDELTHISVIRLLE